MKLFNPMRLTTGSLLRPMPPESLLRLRLNA
jgi:hypothetical protein